MSSIDATAPAAARWTIGAAADRRLRVGIVGCGAVAHRRSSSLVALGSNPVDSCLRNVLKARTCGPGVTQQVSPVTHPGGLLP
jgi:hypothetical protein